MIVNYQIKDVIYLHPVEYYQKSLLDHIWNRSAIANAMAASFRKAEVFLDFFSS